MTVGAVSSSSPAASSLEQSGPVTTSQQHLPQSKPGVAVSSPQRARRKTEDEDDSDDDSKMVICVEGRDAAISRKYHGVYDFV